MEPGVEDTPRVGLRFAVVLASVFLVPLGGCSSADPLWGPDCVSPFHFRGQEYVLGPGPPDVEPVKPGVPLGDGASESCDQYAPGEHRPGDGSDRLTEPRPVYAFPMVPIEQAVVLVNTDGHVSILLAADRPKDGWDPQLRSWLNSRTAR